MASRRYSRILQAARYYAAIDNYINYVKDASKHSTNIGQGRNRPPSQRIYIRPFAVDLAAGQRVMETGSQTAWNAYKGQIGNRAADAAPADSANNIALANYSAARVIITTNQSANGVVKTSRVTGLKYLSYGGQSTSLPFGANADGDDEVAAFTAIRTAILPTLGANSKISHKRERF
jgi:hypothetical protein